MKSSTQHLRLLAVGAVLVCLVGLFVWTGTVSPNPALNDFPGNDQVGPNPDAYVGQHVSLSGTVVATDPVIVEVQYGIDERREITFENLDEHVVEGQHVNAFGTLTDESTLKVENALVRSPWEKWYMYAVSFLGGLWVLGRLLVHWRFDRNRLAFVPRGDRSA